MTFDNNLDTRVLGNLALKKENSNNKEETFSECSYPQLKWTGPSGGIFSGQYNEVLRLRFALLEHENFFGPKSELYEIITGEANRISSSTLAKYVKEGYTKPDTKKIAIGEIFIERVNDNYTIAMFGFMDHAGDSCNSLLIPLIASKLSKLKIPNSRQMKYSLINKVIFY